ncbi:transglutaminase-like domain-containing protein [Actinomadura madurae]|nr:transglutaminase-like domain-containing protein [Actinomadura madurae]
MLAEYLKRYARYDVTAPPGHSYRQLDYFLGEGRRGTPEHFATAYALLARSLGLPSRVVVGFDGGTARAAPSRSAPGT